MAAHAGVEQIRSQRSEIHAVHQAAKSQARGLRAKGLRRVMSREQGRALEMIGHAVDYLQDCALYTGPDHEIVNAASPLMDAVRILISSRYQILQSLPLQETFSQRVWNSIFRRKSKDSAAPAVRLSSR